MTSELADLRQTDPGLVRKIANENPVIIARLKKLLQENKRLGRGPQLADTEFEGYIRYAKSLVRDLDAKGAAVKPAENKPALEQSERASTDRLDQAERERREHAFRERLAQNAKERYKRLADRIASEKEQAFRRTVEREAALELESRRYRESRAIDLRKLSTGDMNLFSVNDAGGGIEVQFASDSVFLFADEVAQLRRGEALGPDHPLTKLLGSPTEQNAARVLYTNASDKRAGSAATSVVDLVFALQKAYPRNRIYRDPFSDRTPGLVKRLNGLTVGSPDDLITIVADGSFGVTDWKVIQNIVPDLRKKGFVNNLVLRKGAVTTWNGGGGKAVTVITGHINEELVSFVEELGKAGYFQDNYVLLNTCREAPTERLVTRIATEHHAAGVFCYDSKIAAADVESAMLELADVVKNRPTARFVDLINETMRKHSLNGVWTLCMGTGRHGRQFVCNVHHDTAHD
jgi:hypothetical protein